MTLGRHVFFRRSPKDIPPRLVRHELIHVCQYREHGFCGFLWRYLWRERKLPYRQKSFEREAFAHEGDPGYRLRRWPRLTLEVPQESSASDPLRDAP